MTPDGWCEESLADLLAEAETGTSVRAQNRMKAKGEVGVLKTSAVTYGVFRPHEHKAVLAEEAHRVKAAVREGSILVSRMNTKALVGASVYVSADHPDLYLPDRIWQLVPARDRADARWLQHLLASPAMREEISELASGTSGSMKNISRVKLFGLAIQRPPLPEQRKIAAILSSVDEVIEKTEAVIEQLQIVKKAMMQELLTRGLPGRHTRFKQTEIGEIPEEWHVRELKELARVFNGKASGTGGTWLRVFKTKHVYDGFVRLDKLEFARDDSAQKVAKESLLQPGDTLTPNMAHGTIGRVAYVPAVEGSWATDGQVMVMRSINVGVLVPRFLFEYMSSDTGRSALLDCEKGGIFGDKRGQTHIYPRDVERIKVPQPSVAEQRSIAMAFESFDRPLETNAESLSALRQLKTGLMQVLLTGELRVTPDECTA